MSACVAAVQNYVNNLIGQGESAAADIEAKHPGTVTAEEQRSAHEREQVLSGEYGDRFAALRSECDNEMAAAVFEQADVFSDYGLQSGMDMFEKRAKRAGATIDKATQDFVNALNALPPDDTKSMMKLRELFNVAELRSSGAR